MSTRGSAPPPLAPSNHSRWRDAGRLALIALGYVVSVKLALFFPNAETMLTLIWPPSGVALAALLLNPRRRWRSILAVIFIVGFVVDLLSGRAALKSAGFNFVDVLEPLACGWLFARWCGEERVTFVRIREVVALTVSATAVNGVSALVGASVARLVIHVPFREFYVTWWISDGLGILLVTPLIVVCAQPWRWPSGRWLWQLEVVTLAVVWCTCAWLGFLGATTSLPIVPQPYWIFVPLIWAGLRFQTRVTSVLLTLLAAIAISITVTGRNDFPLGGDNLGGHLQMVQLFLGVVIITGLALATTVAERKEAEEKISELNRDFVAFLENTGDFIYFKDANSRFRFCSQTLAAITGHNSWRDMIGKHDLEVFPKDTAQVYSEEELPVFRDGQPLLNKVDSFYDAAGNQGWVSTNKWPLLDRAGKIVGLFGISRDITAVRKIDEALRRSQTFLNSIIEHSPNAMWISDDHGTLLRLNQALRDRLRARDEDVVGKYNIFKDNLVEAQGFMPLVREVFARGTTARFVMAYDTSAVAGMKFAQTTEVSLDISISPILDAQGKVTNAIIQHVDITERVRIEEALKASETKLRAILENSNEAIGVHLNGIWVACNPAAARLFGISASEKLIGTSISEVIAPTERARIRDFVRQRQAGTAAPAAYLTRGLRADGTEFDLDVTLSSFTLENRSHVLVILRNVTENRRMEIALRESEERYRSLIDHSPDPILLHQEGLITFVNPAAIQFFGATKPEDLEGTAVMARVHPDFRPKVSERVRQAMAENHPLPLLEEKLLRLDGTVIEAEVSGGSLILDGKPTLQVIVRDISARKLAERAREQALTLLQQIARRVPGVVYQYRLFPDGRSCFPFSSEGMREIYRLAPEEVREDASKVFAVLHPEDYDGIVASIQQSARELIPWRHQYRVKFPDGTVRWLDGNAIPNREPDQSILWHGYLSDITQRKQVEIERQRLSQELQSILEGSRDIIAMLDTEYRYMLFNSAFHDECLRIFGHDFKLGDSMLTALAHLPADLAASKAHWDRAFAGEDFTITQEFGDSALERHWYELHFSPIRNSDGQVVSAVHIVRNITERKRLEAEREQFFKFFLLSSDLMVFADPRGSLKRVNPAALKLLGYSESELLGQPFISFVHPDDRQSTLDEMARQIRIGASMNFVNRYLRKDGSVRWLSWRASYVALENTTYATARDITGERLAEMALRESEKEFRSLAESMPQVVWVTRADGWNNYFNQQWIDYTGLTLEESYGHGWNTPFHPDDRQRAWEAWQNAVQNASPYSLECRLRRGDGVYRWWLVRGVPMRAADGTILKWFGTCTDIEDIKRSEMALRNSEEEFRQLADNITDVFWITSPDFHTMHYVSPGYELVWGRSAASLYAHPHEWTDAILPEDRARVLAELAGLFGNEPTATVEYRIIRPDGSVRWVADRAFQVRDEAGKVIRLTGIARDITERISQEHKLQVLLDQTECDARTKGELLREVNHRVTNTLSSILGLFVGEQKAVTPADRPMVQPMLDRLNQRIHGLLTAHRLLSRTSWAPVQVAQLAEKIITAALSADPSTRAAQITITPNPAEISPRQASSLALVLNELTTNSIKHGRRPESALQLQLEASADAEFVTVCYRDNGPGFPAEVLAGTRKNVGLHLIDKLITESLRGELTLANDSGAVIKLRLRIEEPNRT